MVTTRGWFGRIKDSVMGFFLGLVLIVGSIALLAWNEHRTVKTSRGLDEGKAAAVTTPASPIDASKAGKLVHVSGRTATAEGATDPEFGLAVEGLALRREVEMYQWKEHKKERKEKNLGGSETTITEYTYEKVWDDDRIDSGNFHQPEGHRNPGAFPVQSQRFDAADARLGDYRLNSGQIGSIGGWRRVDPQVVESDEWRAGDGAELYRGDNPASPRVGDVRVRFEELPVSEITVIAEQAGSGFQPWKSSNGTEIDLLEDGAQSIATMFEHAHSSNSTLGWILRAVGFVAMWIGFGMLINPLRVLADVIPFLGRIVGAVGGLVTFIIAAVISLTVIVVSWLVVRPLLVVAIIAGGVGLFLLIGQIRGRKHPPQTAMPPRVPGAYIPVPPSPPPPPPPPR